VEHVDCILLGNDENLALFHVLAEGDPLGELKGVALDPLALGRALIILIFLDLLQGHKKKSIVEGVVEDQLVPS
jgi:hypothetical protein